MAEAKKTKRIDVIHNGRNLIGGKGGLTLIPGRNVGVDAEAFAAAFYGADGKPSETAARFFKAQKHGVLPTLQVEEPSNIPDLDPEAAVRIIATVNDRQLIAKLLQSERREVVIAALKDQQRKLEQSVEKAGKEEDVPQTNQPGASSSKSKK